MTKIRENIYKLMDSFLVEGDKPRPIDRLNQDRHLFVEDMEKLFRSWALGIFDGEWEQYIRDELRGTEGHQSWWFSEIKKKIEEVGK